MYSFTGKWITDNEFCDLKPRNVFHKQLEPVDLPCDKHRNRHILFRKKFVVSEIFDNAKIFISADDYYKLYINGNFAGQGPAPSYNNRYNYNVIDVSEFIVKGENTIAVHTLYQGLINRVWQSGDNRHGLLLDLTVNGKVIVSSDETFKTKPHSAFSELDVVGYQTQFMEEYNSNAAEVGFEKPDFDDSSWQYAKINKYADYTVTEQKTAMLVFEKILPVCCEKKGNVLSFDFGSNYVGYLCVTAVGKMGDTVTIRCGQELDGAGNVRFELRANCRYEETWILADGDSVLDQFDYKSFRYAELVIPDGCEIKDIYMQVRHYPFELKAKLKNEFAQNKELQKIWDLCVHTQKYGVQEVIQDCMDREKGFYMGDGCYSALTNLVLTKDDSMVRKLIDDGFSTTFITDGLVTCMDCSFMQEIAEFPLMMIYLVMWHFRLTGDKKYLYENYKKAVNVLESYRRDYEKDYLLCNLDKWCVVEWPANYQDGYAVDIQEGKVCEQAHISINAYYIEAVKTVNKIASELGLPPYRNEKKLLDAFWGAFYDKKKHLFKDGINTDHISIVGNSFPFGFGLCPDKECEDNIAAMFEARKISSVSFFCGFPVLMGFARSRNEEKIKELLLDESAWRRMLTEGATTTFEGWGKDVKWNTSLFHLTLSYAAVFMADIDLREVFEI